MAAVVGKYAAKKLLGDQFKKYKHKGVAGNEDPYFAELPDPKRPGKTKKVKKGIPQYIPPHDAEILAKMRKRSYAMDMALFSLFGVRFGWSSLLGFIPAAGDVMDAGIALLLVVRCMRVKCGLGAWTLARMLLNVLIDFFIGAVPILGDFADAAYKANTKNTRLLEKRLVEVYKPEGLKEPAGPASVALDMSDDEDVLLVMQERRMENEPRRPEAARMQEERRGGGGWWSGRERRERQPDPELGHAQMQQMRQDYGDNARRYQSSR